MKGNVLPAPLATGPCLPSLPGSPRRVARRHIGPEWRAWGKRHLQTGDILFVRGDHRILLGMVNFSDLSAKVTDSPFSHVGVVAREPDGVFIYDIISSGPRRTEFGRFASDRRVHAVAVKRLQAEYRGHAKEAVAYCRRVTQEKRDFDASFRPGEEQLYCSELVEAAYRRAGVALSQPERIDQLPGFTTVSAITRSLVEASTEIAFDQQVYLPGNDRHGIWSCPTLELVLPLTEVATPPPLYSSGAEIPEEVADWLSGDENLRLPEDSSP